VQRTAESGDGVSGLAPRGGNAKCERLTQRAPFSTPLGRTLSPRYPAARPNEPSQMSWNLLERFIESDHFNHDPSLTVAYLS
jgi:hypothetical protein